MLSTILGFVFPTMILLRGAILCFGRLAVLLTSSMPQPAKRI